MRPQITHFFSKFSGGEYPQTPLQARACGARHSAPEPLIRTPPAQILATGLEGTPKTIIFCNTMQEMASVFGYLLTSLGNYAYATGIDKLPANRIVGIFHSLTWVKYKTRVSHSFKGGGGVLRIVIASSALSMGVNYPDVKYVIHLGPARSVIDHIQQAGRAGRDGCQSYNVVVFYGQQLSQCEQAVKDFVKTSSCFRKALFKTLDSTIESVLPLHKCCNNCADSCECGAYGTCTGKEMLPFELSHAETFSTKLLARQGESLLKIGTV